MPKFIKRIQIRNQDGVLLHSHQDTNSYEPTLSIIQARYPTAFTLTFDIRQDGLGDCGWYEVATIYMKDPI